MEASLAAPAAPAGPKPHEGSARDGGNKSDLFARRKQKSRWVTLPGHEKPFLLVALRPIEVQEINTYCLESVPDPKNPKKEKRQFNVRRPFYLIAKSLCEPDGKPMFGPGANTDAQAALLYGGEQVGSFLTNQECNILFDVVSELSGLGDQAAEDAEKNSERTGNASSSSTKP